MLTGKTKSGFEYSVSEKLGNDFRFVQSYSKVFGKDPGSQLTGVVELANIVLGVDGVAALCDHVAEPDGTVPTDAVMRELVEIVQAAGEANGAVKN